jgi:hypothetical protein
MRRRRSPPLLALRTGKSLGPRPALRSGRSGRPLVSTWSLLTAGTAIAALAPLANLSLLTAGALLTGHPRFTARTLLPAGALLTGQAALAALATSALLTR